MKVEIITPAGAQVMPAQRARELEGKTFKDKAGNECDYRIVAVDGHPVKPVAVKEAPEPVKKTAKKRKGK